MTRLAALFLLFLLGPASAQQAVIVPATEATVQIAGTIATATAIVNGIAGQSIYVTSINLVPVATSVVTFTSGTGATCTTPTSLTGAMTFAAGQTLSLGSGYGAVLVVPQGASLCITIATAVAPGSLSYSQF
jgi:hypothetical protein